MVGKLRSVISTLLIFTVSSTITMPVVGGSTLYVDDDAVLGGDGLTWETSYRFLRDALQFAAEPENGVSEIRVAQGVYKPDRDESNPKGDGYRNKTFQLVDGVLLLGGYAGIGADDPDARDIELYETSLSGDLLGNDGPDFENNDENSFHVVTGTGTFEGTLLEGMTIRSGKAPIGGNVSGAGLYNLSGRLTVNACTFRQNMAQRGGGLAYPQGTGSAIISNCTFISNYSTSSASSYPGGGAIWIYEGNPQIVNCTFNLNISNRSGAAISSNSSSPVIENCVFNNNTAFVGSGGAVVIYLGNATISNCLFNGNSAFDGLGGGIHNYSTDNTEVTNCLFIGNYAGHRGGGFYDLSSNSVVTNCTFSGNSAGEQGGGIGNPAVLNNCIIWDNSPNDIYIFNDKNTWIQHSNIRGGWFGAGSDNIDADPLFVDPLNGDFHLAPGSPCIDSGDNTSVPKGIIIDLDGNQRFLDEPCVSDTGVGKPPVVDMGVYEHQVLFVDCNNNNVRDQCEINKGSSQDNNGNGIPDECEAGQYIGPSGGSWFDSDNWSGSEIPNSSTEVTISVNVVIKGGKAQASIVRILNGGSLTLSNSTLVTQLVDLALGAQLIGYGVITGDVFNRGTISPGLPIGILSILGNYTQTLSGKLNIELAGLEQGVEHDALLVVGATSLNGELAVDFVLPFGPMCNDDFDVLSLNFLPSEFAQVNLSDMPATLNFSVEYSEESVQIEIWPFAFESQKIVPLDVDQGDSFGRSVSISGDVALVGAEFGAVGAGNDGTAFVYRLQQENCGDSQCPIWIKETKLFAFDTDSGDRFGKAVSIDGDLAIVGAYRVNNKGAAYIFQYDGKEWSSPVKVVAAMGAQNGRFGWSVSVSGDRVLVGEYRDDDNGEASGSAYIFKYLLGTWYLESKLLASDGAEDDLFGRAVAISGDVAIAGAMWDDDNGSNSGSAYIFRFDGENWIEESKLSPSDAVEIEWFGYSSDISGDVAIVGALFDNSDDNLSGSAYIFRYDGKSWIEETKLVPSDSQRLDNFGSSVSIDNDTVVVGAWHDDDSGHDSGSAYVFHYDGQTWSQGSKLLASDGAQEDFYGFEVAVSGDYAIVGAHEDDDNGEGSGSAYIYAAIFEDCNSNGFLDSCDIADGFSDDINNNGIPDECEIIGDLNGDGVVSTVDLLILFSSWGQCVNCADCPADINNDCNVNEQDLNLLLNGWG